MRDLIKKMIEKRSAIKFNQVISEITNTPSITSFDDAQVLIVSQVNHHAVKMLLVALKTFIQKLGDCKIELINDGSLTEDDQKLLEKHITNVSIIDINNINVFNCPKGGTWERLCYILKRTQDHYVIQLDSDTVTMGALPEIHQKISENHGFTIGGPMFPKPVSIDYMATLANSWKNEHVQAKAESHLTVLKTLNIKHYLRGCSAFTGFPKGSNLLNLLLQVSKEMEKTLGKETWTEWGTEQFSSNVMQSFCEKSQILAWPKYHNHGFPDFENAQKGLAGYLGRVSFVHFIGSKRFSNNLYVQAIEHSIRSLK